MECSEPGAIRDEELIAYLVGDKVRPAVVQHIAVCQACSSLLATYRRIDLTLTSKLYRWDCPSSQVLGEYQLGMLSRVQITKIKSHLRSCVLCTAEVATLTEFLAADSLQTEQMVTVPKEIVVRVQNNHHPVQEARQAFDHLREKSFAGVRRVVAALIPPQPQLAFQRGTPSTEALWPRRYTAEDVHISIQIERVPISKRGSLQMIGFVTRNNTALEALQGIPVRLLAQVNSQESMQDIDELGNFVFSALTPATYTLELRFPESTVVIEQLMIATEE
jgi:hypothetical protein